MTQNHNFLAKLQIEKAQNDVTMMLFNIHSWLKTMMGLLKAKLNISNGKMAIKILATEATNVNVNKKQII